MVDNDDTVDWKTGERATVKGRLAEELRSREDRLNHSTNVSEVHLAEKGRPNTENGDLLYKTDFQGIQNDEENKVESIWPSGGRPSSKNHVSSLMGKHTRNTVHTEPDESRTFNEEDKDLEESNKEKDFLL